MRDRERERGRKKERLTIHTCMKPTNSHNNTHAPTNTRAERDRTQ